jgi:hypothetical protein
MYIYINIYTYIYIYIYIYIYTKLDSCKCILAGGAVAAKCVLWWLNHDVRISRWGFSDIKHHGWKEPFLIMDVSGDTLFGYYLLNKQFLKRVFPQAQVRQLHAQDFFLLKHLESAPAGAVCTDHPEAQVMYVQELALAGNDYSSLPSKWPI